MKIDKDYKIRVTPEESEQVQKICFEQGIYWLVGREAVIHNELSEFPDGLFKELFSNEKI